MTRDQNNQTPVNEFPGGDVDVADLVELAGALGEKMNLTEGEQLKDPGAVVVRVVAEGALSVVLHNGSVSRSATWTREIFRSGLRAQPRR